jgi:hypothetical protein
MAHLLDHLFPLQGFLFLFLYFTQLGQVFETVADYLISSIPMYFMIKVTLSRTSPNDSRLVGCFPSLVLPSQLLCKLPSPPSHSSHLAILGSHCCIRQPDQALHCPSSRTRRSRNSQQERIKFSCCVTPLVTPPHPPTLLVQFCLRLLLRSF